jgi:hypothetical protein
MSALRSRAALLLALLLAAVALVATACSSDDGPDAPPPGGPGSPASFVPADAPVYIDATTDDAGEQWGQALALANRFPAFQGLVADAEQELADEDITFDDLRGVAGDRAAFAFLRLPDTEGQEGATPAETEDPFLAVVELEPGQGDAALDLFRKNEAGLDTPKGEHAGVDYYFNGDDTAVAVKDDTLIVASGEADLFAALDARDSGDGLSGVDRFKQTLDGLPTDTAATVYLDVASLFKALSAETPELEDLGLAGIGENAAVGIGAQAEGEGVRLTGVAPNVPSGGGAGGFSPTLLDKVPDTAIAYLGFQDPASAIATGFGDAQGEAAEGLKQQVEFFSGQLQAALGVSTDDLAALFGGEAGVAVLPGGEFPGVVIMLKVDDAARAQRTLDKLRTGIPQILGATGAGAGGRFRQVPLENGVKGWELPIMPGLSATYGIEGDVVYIGTSSEAIVQVQSPEKKLTDSARFTAATSGLPDSLNGMVYIDAQQLIGALRDAGILDELPTEIAENLGPLGGIAAWDVPGDPPKFQAFVGVEK